MLKGLVDSGAEEEYVRLYQGVYTKDMAELSKKWDISSLCMEKMQQMQEGMSVDLSRMMKGEMKCLVEDVVAQCSSVIGRQLTDRCLQGLQMVERGLSKRELQDLAGIDEL